MKSLFALAVALVMVMPGIALAQTFDWRVVELGAQGSKRIHDSAPVALSLRLTVPLHLQRRTAIEVTADIQKSYVFEREFGGVTRRSARGFSAHWRQTVFTSGRWQIYGVLGGGRNRVDHDVPEQVFQTKDGPRVTPAYRFAASEFVAHFGPAVEVELAPWLAFRGDLRGTIGDDNRGVRGMVGAVIPFGRSRATGRPAGSTRPPAAWKRVKPGREVWVWLNTNARSLVHGDVVAISDSSLIIREQGRDVTVRLDDVRSVEELDSNTNGFLIGAASGGVAGGLVSLRAASGICGSCEIDGGDWILPGAVRAASSAACSA